MDYSKVLDLIDQAASALADKGNVEEAWALRGFADQLIVGATVPDTPPDVACRRAYAQALNAARIIGCHDVDGAHLTFTLHNGHRFTVTHCGDGLQVAGDLTRTRRLAFVPSTGQAVYVREADTW